MNIPGIYHLLFEGKKLEIPFASRKDAEGFRVRLQQYKGFHEQQMLGLGMITEEERQRLSFTVVERPGELIPEDLIPTNGFIATLQFCAKMKLKEYQVKIIEEEDSEKE